MRKPLRGLASFLGVTLAATSITAGCGGGGGTGGGTGTGAAPPTAYGPVSVTS